MSQTDVQLVQGCKGYTLCPDTRTLLIIDDFSPESEEANIGELFSVSSHHLNTSVFYVTHNLFLQTRSFRLAALNAQYYVLFKSIRGAGQIATLARQVLWVKRARGNASWKHTQMPHAHRSPTSCWTYIPRRPRLCVLDHTSYPVKVRCWLVTGMLIQ